MAEMNNHQTLNKVGSINNRQPNDIPEPISPVFSPTTQKDDNEIRIEEYLMLIAKIETEFGNVSTEMSQVLQTLCEILKFSKNIPEKKKTLEIWIRISEIETALYNDFSEKNLEKLEMKDLKSRLAMLNRKENLLEDDSHEEQKNITQELFPSDILNIKQPSFFLGMFWPSSTCDGATISKGDVNEEIFENNRTDTISCVQTLENSILIDEPSDEFTGATKLPLLEDEVDESLGPCSDAIMIPFHHQNPAINDHSNKVSVANLVKNHDHGSMKKHDDGNTKSEDEDIRCLQLL